MAQFMFDHPNLAKTLLPNCGQGKERSRRLWEELANRLNACGPPTKEMSVWRKVYADQEHNVKKKLSLNKESKMKTGGGPYEEIPLSQTEEQIVQAAGIEASVDGNSTIKSFGKRKEPNETFSCQVEKSIQSILDENSELERVEKETPKPKKQKTNSKAESKIDLLMTNINKNEEFHTNLNSKLERLLELKERSLKLKEEEHTANMAISLKINNNFVFIFIILNTNFNY
ncbi:uncharacterized protein LOC135955557 [Calliphora vicina]|uniref:uncharacterized protein LOC135955557 n=1 Tax=Calliphora vicina TaxID=7373 RepID=UPI00325B185B